MLEFTQHAVVVVAFLMVPISLCLWFVVVGRWQRGEPLLELAPRRAVPWSLLDLLLIAVMGFFVLVATQLLCMRWYELPAGGWELNDLSGEQLMGVLLSFSLSSVVACVVAVAVCRWRSGATGRDLGWDLSAWPLDLVLGISGFALLIVPVLSIHFIAQLVFPTEETHPFIELIMKDPRIEYLAPITFAAVIAAPLVEEFFFRVLFQGWLERSVARLEHKSAPASPKEETIPEGQNGALPEGETFGAGTDDVDVSNPYQSPASDDDTATARRDTDLAPPLPESLVQPALPQTRSLRLLVIVISSSAFAMAHFGHGPAPISLFVLAVGLGYLYQRTHRILPCMVVHFLVNLTAVVQLAIAVATSQA